MSCKPGVIAHFVECVTSAKRGISAQKERQTFALELMPYCIDRSYIETVTQANGVEKNTGKIELIQTRWCRCRVSLWEDNGRRKTALSALVLNAVLCRVES
jgi:hypothetical protein